MKLKQLFRSVPRPLAPPRPSPGQRPPVRDRGRDTASTKDRGRILALHDFFERQVDMRPEAMAVIHGETQVTYRSLEQQANRLARHLRSQGVRRGSRVAFLLPRSIEAYASLLGIMKTGAAYVPLDPSYPQERIEYILDNSKAEALVTLAEFGVALSGFGGALVRLDADADKIATQSPYRLPRASIGVAPDDLCYIIYTSGSTGRPKGVMIEHRNAAHLVRAEGEVFAVQAHDRVYQGASLSFDLSVEEVWLAFCAGATLIPASPELVYGGPDLAAFLREQQVTVLSCVPTMLAMLTEDVPNLRLLILGGEACPQQLVERWACPGRRLVNTYGPTETTVIATYADLDPDQPVTIGQPLPGYRVHVLDDALQPLPAGDVGEICIGGAGVARGYIDRPEENAAHFIPDPFAPTTDADVPLYRTGDLGRLADNGDIEYMGRADDQVKIRGFRVELTEIESVLMLADNISAAACTLREDTPGLPQLIAYVVPRDGAAVDEAQLRQQLRNQLPAYMVPALVETLAELPLLPSGKLDRKALPPPQPRATPQPALGKQPRSETERYLSELWHTLFQPLPVAVDDDFFLDLGGHSLLAARAVSELRKQPRFAHVSVLDIYHHPTITALAAVLDAQASTTATAGEASPTAIPAGERLRHFTAGLLQSLSLYLHFGIRAGAWLAPYLVYFLLLYHEYPALEAAGWAMTTALAMAPALLLIAVAAKWLILGHIRPGRYPLWGSYYLRWWFVHGFVQAAPLASFTGTPILPFLLRLFGTRIGRDVHLDTYAIEAFDLVSIGDGSSIDEEVSLSGCRVEGQDMIVGPIAIGRHCFIGSRCVLQENTHLADGARLESLSLLATGGAIAANETWAGSPAAATRRSLPPRPPRPTRTPWQQTTLSLYYASCALLLPFVLLIAAVPGLAVLTYLDPWAQPILYLALLPVLGACYVLLVTCIVALSKQLLVGRVAAGCYPLHGAFYRRHWVVEHLLSIALHALGQLHATLYLAPWYRALGARIGRFVELSTATVATPDMIQLDDGSTVADEVSLGSPHIEAGWMTIKPTRLGRRAFIGNSGVVSSGIHLGDASLVGVLSIAPNAPEQAAQPGASWLGSPPLLLPRRQPSANFTEQRTYQPPPHLRRARATFELLRVNLPPALMILMAVAIVLASLQVYDVYGLAMMLLMLPLLYGIAACALFGLVVLAKWTIIGRFQPFSRPLWSLFVWRLELVNALYEFLLVPMVLSALRGTPLLPWGERAFGARIGRRVYLDTTGFLEFDLVHIGDRASIDENCVLQSHLFEDRILKASYVDIGANCSVGAFSVVLYDSTMEDGARLDALSLLMKGETLPANTRWAGTPAQRHRSAPTADQGAYQAAGTPQAVPHDCSTQHVTR